MKILCHRGAWSFEVEKNSMSALKKALSLGYGFESDLRDYRGELVISHDIADENSPLAEEVFKVLSTPPLVEVDAYFAINIKADGLVVGLKSLIEKYSIKNYFVFDMSLPQMLSYRAAGLIFFTRQSEFEKIPLLYEDSAGIWLDSFISDDWINADLIQKHFNAGKKVCVVSPELHGRSPYELWAKLKLIDNPNLFLCTDLLTKAEEFFGGEKLED